MEKTYEVFLDNGNGQYEFEGVFTSLKEVALYLEIPKAIVTQIANGEYDDIANEYKTIIINQVFGPHEYQADLDALRKPNKEDNKEAML